MSLTVTLSNALSGMHTNQDGLAVLSRNVANAGTPGYHRQSLSVIDTLGATSTFARSGSIERAFNRSLQTYYTNAISDTSFSTIRSDILDRLQGALGKPGDPGSLDTMFGALQNALQALGTSPDNFATRSMVISSAQEMAATLNALTRDVQQLRQETETQIAAAADALNLNIAALARINERLTDSSTDEASRAALTDQRDRLVADIAQYIDIRVEYHPDGSVAVMTKNGVGLLDAKAAVFSFEPAGPISATKLFDADSEKTNVGRLLLTTGTGAKIDLAQQRVVQSGSLGALFDLRDNVLVTAQNQLDEIAAGLAQAFSTITTSGTATTSGTLNGFSLDLASIRDGNDLVLNYSKGGVEKSIKIVRVDDTSKLPLDYIDANGTRVVGMDFSAGAAQVAGGLTTLLGPGFTVSSTGTTLTVLDDGTAGTTDVNSLVRHTTSTDPQDGSLALSLFVDSGNTDFTNSLSGQGQRVGFAGRISVNTAVLADSTLLVKNLTTTSLGDAARPGYLLDQLQSMRFASSQTSAADVGSHRLGGTVSDLIGQTMNHVGAITGAALADTETQEITMETLNQRMNEAYGVNVDEEMARLMELQNAYAANSRIIGVVQELLNRLFEI